MIAALIFEGVLRVMAASPWWRILPAVQAQFDAPDAQTGYAHRPNVSGLWLRENRAFVRINAQGLRDRPREQTARPGTIRIAVAGDSVTEALQVDERDLFTLRAERKLRQRGRGFPVELLNFGLSGALPLQQLLFIANRGLPMGIDGAVFIFSAHDFLNRLMRDDSMLPAYIDTPSGDLAIGRSYRTRRSHRLAETWVGEAFFRAVDNSLVLNALYIRAKQGFLLPAEQNPAGLPDALGCGVSMPILLQHEQLWLHGEPAWAARRLDRFFQDVSETLKGKPVLFLLSGFTMPEAECSAALDIRNRVVAQVKSTLEKAGFSFVDLEMAVAQKRRDSGDPARPISFGKGGGGGHLNPWGHEIYAQILAEALAERLPAAGRIGVSR